MLQHEQLLERYRTAATMDATKSFLLKNYNVLLHKHTVMYLLGNCLNEEMDASMRLVCRQLTVITEIREFSKSLKCRPREAILPFFARLEEKKHSAALRNAIQVYIERIQARAVQQRKKMVETTKVGEKHQEAEEKGSACPEEPIKGVQNIGATWCVVPAVVSEATIGMDLRSPQ